MESGERACGKGRHQVQTEARVEAPRGYAPPRIVSIGSLRDLTRGGDTSADDDGVGFAGASGSF